MLIDIVSRKISISHHAELLGISRSSVYYEPVVDEYDLLLKRLIDKQYTLTPFYGSRKMTEQLRRDEYIVNRKHNSAADEERQGIHSYFGFYNDDRLHQALKYRTPAEVYFQRAS